MRVRVQVTVEDIDNGVRRDCWKCPVALALWRSTGVRWSVSEHGSASVVGSCGQLSIDLPYRVNKFVAAFDDDTFVKPIAFDVEFSVVAVVQPKG